MTRSVHTPASALAATPAAPHGAEPSRRVFESLEHEYDYEIDEIEGRLPAELTGTLYRNGPAKHESSGKPFGHLFDGDGMLSQFVFAAGRVRYRNRFVRTNHYLAGLSGRATLRGVGTQRQGGLLANALRLPANVANTSVTWHAGQLLALCEWGRPWRLDPDTLETLGEYSFDGALRRMHVFSAHPKRDPQTGELFNFGVQYGPITRIYTYRVDPTGRLHRLRPISLPYAVINHDFALTEKHLVFVLAPIIVQPVRMLLGLTSPMRAVRFDPSRSTRIALVPRDGGKPVIVECEPFVYIHVNNAFEDGLDTVIDLVRYTNFAPFDAAANFRGTDFAGLDSALWRLRISRSGVVESRIACLDTCEFPQHDPRRTSRPHRFSYFVGLRAMSGEQGDAIVKLDHATGARHAHELRSGSAVGTGEVAGEPIFVPRAPDAGEDDGWLVSLVYSPREHRSRLVILDARDPEADPVVQAWLRHHVPYGFHGLFTDRIAVPQQSPNAC